jgi:hypothetical protein
VGELDRLISPPFNLTGLESAWLEFEYAYAKKWDQFTDSLFVNVSSDCGISWTRVYANGDDGNGSFATHEPTENFWPEVVTDWCMLGWGAPCVSINLDQWKGQSGIMFAFETYSNFGNPLFIDNIRVSQYVGQTENTSDSESISIYPNPASNQFRVTLAEDIQIDEISLVNQLGQVVYKSSISSNENSIQIRRKNSWNPGIYYLKANSKTNSITKKVIIY